MDKHTFMKLLDVSWADYHAQDPTAIGMVVIVLHKGDDDEMEAQVGGNVAPGVVRYALLNLTASMLTGSGPEIAAAPPRHLRKAV